MFYYNRALINLKRRVATILVLFIIIGCGSKDLSREKAESLLIKKYEKIFKDKCSLNSIFSEKPEFVGIKDLVLCETQPVVTGIRKITETEAEVEWKLVKKSRPQELKLWLEATDKLNERLLTLRAKPGGFLAMYWVFRDPTDGQEFVDRVANSARQTNIKNTGQWRTIDAMKQYVIMLLEKGQVEDQLSRNVFRLYDDGWRIAE